MTSDRTPYDHTHQQHSDATRNRLGSNIGVQPHGKPQELTVDPVDDHDESGAEMFESCGWAAKSIRLQLFYVLFPLPIILELFVSIQARLRT